jgi:TP53 regulating kinase-like protein
MEIGDVLCQCAEATVHHCNFYGHRAVLKHRVAKSYRHPVLDKKIREQRTCREARALARCRRIGVPAPDVYNVDKERCHIVMQHVDGVTARDFIASCAPESALPAAVLERIGAITAMLHEADQIHGDLTTSNFILPDFDRVDSMVVIDFGLVKESTSAEERAVDLYVLERAVGSTHPLLPDPAASIMRGYLATLSAKKGKQTNDRLAQVRARGRKRSMLG